MANTTVSIYYCVFTRVLEVVIGAVGQMNNNSERNEVFAFIVVLFYILITKGLKKHCVVRRHMVRDKSYQCNNRPLGVELHTAYMSVSGALF